MQKSWCAHCWRHAQMHSHTDTCAHTHLADLRARVRRMHADGLLCSVHVLICTHFLLTCALASDAVWACTQIVCSPAHMHTSSSSSSLHGFMDTHGRACTHTNTHTHTHSHACSFTPCRLPPGHSKPGLKHNESDRLDRLQLVRGMRRAVLRQLCKAKHRACYGKAHAEGTAQGRDRKAGLA